MNRDLKPCPFCGSTRVSVRDFVVELGMFTHYQVNCHECGCSGPDVMIDRHKAVSAWNATSTGKEGVVEETANRQDGPKCGCKEASRGCDCLVEGQDYNVVLRGADGQESSGRR